MKKPRKEKKNSLKTETIVRINSTRIKFQMLPFGERAHNKFNKIELSECQARKFRLKTSSFTKYFWSFVFCC